MDISKAKTYNAIKYIRCCPNNSSIMYFGMEIIAMGRKPIRI